MLDATISAERSRRSRRRPGARRGTRRLRPKSPSASCCTRRTPIPATSANGSCATATRSTSASRASAIRCRATLANHCGAVIFGGPMSANDKDEFIRRETEWIGVRAEGETSRSSASASARRCWPAISAPRSASIPRSWPRSAITRFATTEAGSALGRFPDHVYQWHREGFELPRGARLLATSNGAFPNQAFAYGPRPSACSSIPRSPTPRCTAGPATTPRASA